MAVARRTDRPNTTKPWQASYRDHEKNERTRSFARKVDADRWLRDQLSALDHGTYVDPQRAKVTLREYAEAWQARVAPSWRPSTAKMVTVSLQNHVLPVLGARPLVSIRRGDLERLYAALPLAPSTVALVSRHVAQVFTAAVEDGLVAKSPATKAKRPRVDAMRAEPVSPEVVDAITEALPEWMRIVVPLGVGVGLRQSEVSGLTVDRVNFFARTLRVDRQFVAGEVVPPKTRSSARPVPLPSFVVDALAAYLACHPREPGDFVLLDDDGRPVTAQRFSPPWRRAVEYAGVPGLRFHALRHTFASTLLSNGVSIKAVSEWLGHASPVVTLSTYSHLMPTDDEVGRRVLDAAFSTSRGPAADLGVQEAR